MEIRWKVSPLNHEAASNYAHTLGVSPLIGQIIANRNVADGHEFLNPSLKSLHNPSLMFGMEKAAARIVEAIKAKDKIIVYGDYDVDGITGTVTLMQAIKMYGGVVDYYIPHRSDEGYGLHDESIARIIEDGAKLIVSVDCGVTAVGPAKVAKEKGIDLIITDHHEFHLDNLPDCYTIVHPRLGDTPYPNGNICGSGVAFKVAWAIGKLLHDGNTVEPSCAPFFLQAMAFTALGTIADVVPLIGENRTIAHFGLKQIPRSCFDGLRALVASAHLEDKDIDGYKVGFTLAPRLNAAGRMGHANLAVKMLTNDSYTTALGIAESLEKQNVERQTTERKIVKEAETQVAQMEAAGVPMDIMIVRSSHWHHGVVGIVASRLSEKYHRPALVLVCNGTNCGGSGRSVEGFNLTQALEACREHLTTFGGHAAACGVKLPSNKLDVFREAMCAYAREHMTPEMKTPVIKIECEATLDDMTEKFTTELQKVGPFGMGNRRPFFVFNNVLVKDAKRIGKEAQFLMFIGEQGERSMKFVWFKPTAEALNLAPGAIYNVCAEPTLNEYKGKTTVELLVRDMRPAASKEEKSESSFAFSPT
jgi:single-stranded-DNA-specific exonuclease